MVETQCSWDAENKILGSEYVQRHSGFLNITEANLTKLFFLLSQDHYYQIPCEKYLWREICAQKGRL